MTSDNSTFSQLDLSGGGRVYSPLVRLGPPACSDSATMCQPSFLQPPSPQSPSPPPSVIVMPPPPKCTIAPPADCNGHGTLQTCNCQCSPGFANDFSVRHQKTLAVQPWLRRCRTCSHQGGACLPLAEPRLPHPPRGAEASTSPSREL